MTAKDLLELNGDFRNSPLLDTARKLHRLLKAADAAYTIIGGLAVVRNGAVRTTRDIDVLIRREDWPRIERILQREFRTEIDSAVDKETGIPVDFLYAGDSRDMVLALPDPAEVSEYDSDLEANFLSLAATIQLKIATYLQKKRDEGIEIAAKDLADVVALLESNLEDPSPEAIGEMHSRIAGELRRIQKRLRRKKG